MTDLRLTLFLLLSLAVGCPSANDDDSATDDDDSVGDDDDSVGDDDDSAGDDDDSGGDDDDSGGDDDDDDSVAQTQCAIPVPGKVERLIELDVNPASLPSVVGFGAGFGSDWDAFEVPNAETVGTESVVAVQVTFSPPLVLPGADEADDFRIAIHDWEGLEYDVNALQYFGASAAVQGSATISENALGFEVTPNGWAVTTYFAPADGAEIQCVVIGWAFTSDHSGTTPTIELQPKSSSWSP